MFLTALLLLTATSTWTNRKSNIFKPLKQNTLLKIHFFCFIPPKPWSKFFFSFFNNILILIFNFNIFNNTSNDNTYIYMEEKEKQRTRDKGKIQCYSIYIYLEQVRPTTIFNILKLGLLSWIQFPASWGLSWRDKFASSWETSASRQWIQFPAWLIAGLSAFSFQNLHFERICRVSRFSALITYKTLIKFHFARFLRSSYFWFFTA